MDSPKLDSRRLEKHYLFWWASNSASTFDCKFRIWHNQYKSILIQVLAAFLIRERPFMTTNLLMASSSRTTCYFAKLKSSQNVFLNMTGALLNWNGFHSHRISIQQHLDRMINLQQLCGAMCNAVIEVQATFSEECFQHFPHLSFIDLNNPLLVRPFLSSNQKPLTTI